jgi:hypothetical protein
MQGREPAFPVAFRPYEPDPELEDLRGMRVLVTRSRDTPGVVKGAMREGGTVFCWVVTANYSGWFPVADLEPDLEPPPDIPTPVGVDVFG